jgi:predicted nucleic acid-binding Zn ribbon protein
MPQYTFEHPDTGETIDVFQRMNDKHKYTDEDGVEWRRVFYAPAAVVDGKMSPWALNKMVEKTGNSKGTVGDLFDLSKEMAAKRAKENGGIDPWTQKAKDQYSKERLGRKHTNSMSVDKDVTVTI